MRSPYTYLAGVVLAGPLLALAPGCDSAMTELQKEPAVKAVDPMTDMPGYKEMQEKMKSKVKSKGKVKK
jgi:hypothetical protein